MSVKGVGLSHPYKYMKYMKWQFYFGQKLIFLKKFVLLCVERIEEKIGLFFMHRKRATMEGKLFKLKKYEDHVKICLRLLMVISPSF